MFDDTRTTKALSTPSAPLKSTPSMVTFDTFSSRMLVITAEPDEVIVMSLVAFLWLRV